MHVCTSVINLCFTLNRASASKHSINQRSSSTAITFYSKLYTKYINNRKQEVDVAICNAGKRQKCKTLDVIFFSLRMYFNDVLF